MADQLKQSPVQDSMRAVPESSATEPGISLQFQQELADLPIEVQMDRVRPPLPVSFSQSGVPDRPSQPVQMAGDPGARASEIKSLARDGLQGPSSSLPHLNAIQSSFGAYDVSGVKAHTGSQASKASEAMGASAYATGDHVAFKSTPDLHTAAHEAAHVIQQQHGVSLSQGVGQVGDTYERHADAVADRVVQGEDASGLLSQMGPVQGRFDRPVQRYAGDVDTATVSTPAGEQSVRSVAEGRFGGARDTNFNPALKVEFEVALGRALLMAQEFYRPVVERVSHGIYRYLQAKAEVLGQEEKKVMEESFKAMSFMHGDNLPDVFYGRIVDNLSNEEEYFGKMLDLLKEGTGTIQNHMLAHQCFLDKILDKADAVPVAGVSPAQTYITEMQEMAARRKEFGDSQLARASAPNLKHLRLPGAGGENPFGVEQTATGDVVENPTLGEGSRAARGRYDQRKGFNTKKGGYDPTAPLPAGMRYDTRLADSSRRAEHSVGIAAEENVPTTPALTPEEEAAGLGQRHSRGIEQYTLDESQKFIQDARTIYNMPLAAGISGTTTDLHEVAKMFGCTSEIDVFKYQLACLAHLQTAGAHSFHEIMAAAAMNTSVQYEPGNYRSILKYGLDAVPAIMALFNDPKYAGIPGIDASAPSSDAVAAGLA
ncbi:MAG: DUF4157 domain-containing protein [Bradymonadales bacterium]|nr:DUF4157 domain-containing protein [Bradymonadales bacterium]